MTDVSLKEYFDQRIDAVDNKIVGVKEFITELNKQRDIARSLALAELERRLTNLNHAHERAEQALATYLSREIWDKYREEDIVWKRQAEVLRANSVTQEEFNSYKETTQQALTLSAGQKQGVGSVWSTIVITFSVLAAIGTISTAVLVIFRLH